MRLGADKDGTINGIDMYTLSNTGAYGEHGPTTVGLSGHKSIPLYGKAKAFRLSAMLSIPITCPQARTGDTERPRDCLQWSRP